MTAETIGRLLAWAWRRPRRKPARSPLQAAGDELRAAVAAAPAGLASVQGMGPEMRAFNPATDPRCCSSFEIGTTPTTPAAAATSSTAGPDTDGAISTRSLSASRHAYGAPSTANHDDGPAKLAKVPRLRQAREVA